MKKIFDSYGHRIVNKLLKNKRGDDMLVDFWAILVFAIVLVIFFVIFYISGSKNVENIDNSFQNTDADYMLQSFLNSPAVGEDPTKTVSYIISEDVAKDDFKRTKRLFNSYFGKLPQVSGGYTIGARLEIDGSQDSWVQSENLVASSAQRTSKVYTSISGYDGVIVLTLTVYYVDDVAQAALSYTY
jgi:hypothetical protein